MDNPSKPLLFLSEKPQISKFTSTIIGGGKRNVPARPDRDSHAQRLISELEKSLLEIEQAADAQKAISLAVHAGNYLLFSGEIGYDLIFENLESQKDDGIRLLSVKEENAQTSALIFVPHGQERAFLKKLGDYERGQVFIFDIDEAEKLLLKELKNIDHDFHIVIRKKKGVDGNRASVFVPKILEPVFRQKLDEWNILLVNLEVKKPQQDFIDSIETIQRAVVKFFWQSRPQDFPENKKVWCEIWLRREVGDSEASVLEDIKTICQPLEIHISNQKPLHFPNRTVVLAQVDEMALSSLIMACDRLAEFRKAEEVADYWLRMKPVEQAEWAADLLERIQVEPSNVAVCILDTGVNNGHLLLAPVLEDKDCQTVEPLWQSNDHHGHGTCMAGIAAFGELEKHLSGNQPISIRHRLESVKILPPQNFPASEKEFYGTITQQAVIRAEIQRPGRKRVLTLANSSQYQTDRGKPSSWSGAIDQICFGSNGRSLSIKRLMVIAASNVGGNHQAYPNSCKTTQIESPGQSWNALTIGAFTEKAQINDPMLAGYLALAPVGGLSPSSSTGLVWEPKWPNKPDVVFEGGNLAHQPLTGSVASCESLSLISTNYQPQTQMFWEFGETSAATAQAAWFAAQVMADYPKIWPETVRGLMVHSACWTEKMKEQFLGSGSKKDYKNLLRTCGYGVPQLGKAVGCLQNSLTLIAEQEIQPFIFEKKGKSKGDPKLNEMHLFKLPWPEDVLKAMGEAKVCLRITLSYFIDPSPGEIGWKDKYRYQSHGLRFDINLPTDKDGDFQKRINKDAREEDEQLNKVTSSDRWTLGSIASGRNNGSIHSDFIENTTAAELASCNLIAVYPTAGWWKARPKQGSVECKTRYSLIVSLETPDQQVDIYTPVEAMVRVAVPI